MKNYARIKIIFIFNLNYRELLYKFGKILYLLASSEHIKYIFLFSELETSEIEKIRAFSSLKKYKKGEILFLESEPYGGFYCLLEGTVKLFKISKEGREHIVHLVYPGNIFAEVPLFDNYSDVKNNQVEYPINAMAIEDDTEVIIIPSAPFMNILDNNKDVCLKMLANFSKRLKILNKHITSVPLQDVKKRLAQYLLSELENQELHSKKEVTAHNKVKQPSEEFIELSISKYDLASLLGTILETLSRSFKKLQEEEIIKVNGKRIYILNRFKLQSFIS
jgi:CRP/FNR family transcriptional regulator, dissimilatory nitrate respiration regulator